MTSHPLARYEAFLIQNSPIINTIESSLRSLTWFLPGRFKDADLASESLTTGLNLLSLYHDVLLARRLSGEKVKPLIPPSEHSRYTRAWADKQSTYKYAARALEIIRFTQLLFEMVLRRRTAKQNTWRGIVVLEFIKCEGISSYCYTSDNSRPLLFPTLPVRELDPSNIGDMLSTSRAERQALDRPRTPDHIKNNRATFPPVSSSKPSALFPQGAGSATNQHVDDLLFAKALTPASVSPQSHSFHPSPPLKIGVPNCSSFFTPSSMVRLL
ncbi:peroxisomal membrane protein-domain-containing protein [Cantharellus anzutake]|uniref:peroxisomal membrane protein-domain-containing protein n=1 Tax=Cantharellus anzutake TaxID=1750568 RepID=UPI0019051E8B|nr:peroxisomal membrane protein-domain-containing protein [Cantharellus anzutake]KAF8328167.1 peroxisomal membrane protein-domain-containing protein [Cantharellus anzutake]